jgi:hypothetical protein
MKRHRPRQSSPTGPALLMLALIFAGGGIIVLSIIFKS